MRPQTGLICLWMIKVPTRCCGSQTAAPECAAELRRSAPSWTDPRDTSIPRRQAGPQTHSQGSTASVVKAFTIRWFTNLVRPQVVCKEVIWNTRAYWEVEFSGWVVIGATYEGAGRRANAGPSGLGENEESWGLCWAGTRYQIWYNGVNKDIENVPHCSTIGVYLDQPAGIIAFYAVTGDGTEREVVLLHTVKTALDRKILPGFWMGIQSWCTILKRPE